MPLMRSLRTWRQQPHSWRPPSDDALPRVALWYDAPRASAPPTLAATTRGAGRVFATTADDVDILPTIRPAGGFLFLVLARLTSAGNFPMSLTARTSSGSVVEMRCNGTSGRPEFTVNANGVPELTATSASSILSVGPVCLVGEYSPAGVVRLWQDGLLVAEATGSGAAVSWDSNPWRVGDRYLDGGGFPWQGEILFAAVLDGADGAQTISANPWQLFRPKSIWVPIASAGGGGVSLSVADAAHAHNAESPTLTSSTALTAADSTHGHTADALSLSSSTALAVAEATHGHAADGIVLSTSAGLQVADASHAHGGDSLTLTVAGQTLLAVADAGHGHAADALALTTQTGLAIADALHAHNADSPTIAFNGSAALIVEDAAHQHLADQVALFFSTGAAADAAGGRGKRRKLYLGPEQRYDEQPSAPATQPAPKPATPSLAPAVAPEPAPQAVRLADVLPTPAPRAAAPIVDLRALTAVQAALAVQEAAMAQVEAVALERRRQRIEAHNRAAMAAAELLLIG